MYKTKKKAKKAKKQKNKTKNGMRGTFVHSSPRTTSIPSDESFATPSCGSHSDIHHTPTMHLSLFWKAFGNFFTNSFGHSISLFFIFSYLIQLKKKMKKKRKKSVAISTEVLATTPTK
jgi:hypothetical protein